VKIDGIPLFTDWGWINVSRHIMSPSQTRLPPARGSARRCPVDRGVCPADSGVCLRRISPSLLQQEQHRCRSGSAHLRRGSTRSPRRHTAGDGCPGCSSARTRLGIAGCQHSSRRCCWSQMIAQVFLFHWGSEHLSADPHRAEPELHSSADSKLRRTLPDFRALLFKLKVIVPLLSIILSLS